MDGFIGNRTTSNEVQFELSRFAVGVMVLRTEHAGCIVQCPESDWQIYGECEKSRWTTRQSVQTWAEKNQRATKITAAL